VSAATERDDEARDDAPRSSLCPRCAHVQIVVSGKGSTFYLCRRSRTDPLYPKYPAQPVAFCPGYEKLVSP
jgi:hypothetical protein